MFWSRKHRGHQRWRIPEIGSRGLTVPHRSGAPRGMFKPLESGPGVKITPTNHTIRESSWIVGLEKNNEQIPNRWFPRSITRGEKYWQILTVFLHGVLRAPDIRIFFYSRKSTFSGSWLQISDLALDTLRSQTIYHTEGCQMFCFVWNASKIHFCIRFPQQLVLNFRKFRMGGPVFRPSVPHHWWCTRLCSYRLISVGSLVIFSTSTVVKCVNYVFWLNYVPNKT